MTTKRRGRPPKSEEGKATAEKARVACAKAMAALGQHDASLAAEVLLAECRKIVQQNKKLGGAAGHAEIGKCAATITRAFHWGETPPTEALADLIALLLADGELAPYGAPDPIHAQRRALIKYLAEAPDPSAVTPAKAEQEIGVSWKTVKKWLAIPEIRWEAAELRLRHSKTDIARDGSTFFSWARDAHKDAARLERGDNRDAYRTPIAVVRDTLKPEPMDSE